ncbi:hypothetical protein WN944_000580 [Citrus x changshan-huyou]|uniref:Legume lectin domain-containing protein n=1 Tax=Citrus x changshan-huyou TaxID=2935761 RepID=A0AAP0QQF6_9ROSI
MISTTFTIRISPYTNTTDSADGMTFVLATDTSPPSENSLGEYLGLAISGGNFSPLAVELDTFKNGYDPDDNHIGVDVASLTSDPAESLESFGIELKSGIPIQVKIYYDGWTKILYVYVAYAGNPLQKLIERPTILSETVPSSVYVGFTAATGPIRAESHQFVYDHDFDANTCERKDGNGCMEQNCETIIPEAASNFFLPPEQLSDHQHLKEVLSMVMLLEALKLKMYMDPLQATHATKRNAYNDPTGKLNANENGGAQSDDSGGNDSDDNGDADLEEDGDANLHGDGYGDSEDDVHVD